MTIDPQTPDRELIEACQDVQDDRFEAAFEELYRRYRDRVYSIAYRITGSTTDAMDVVQESFRVLFLKISTFRFDARFSTWLFRIVVNCSIDLKRRERDGETTPPRPAEADIQYLKGQACHFRTGFSGPEAARREQPRKPVRLRRSQSALRVHGRSRTLRNR